MKAVHDPIGRQFMSLPLRVAIASACTCLVTVSTLANEGEWRWRIFDHQERLSLMIVATDLGTDDIGYPWFDCKRGSGWMKVRGVMNEQLRHALADMIRADQYPRVELVPEAINGWNPIEVSYSEIVGWEYSFSFSADAQAFDLFKQTGVFQFKLSDTLIQEEFQPGLENVAKFQDACRKPIPRQSGEIDLSSGTKEWPSPSGVPSVPPCLGPQWPTACGMHGLGGAR